MRRLSFAIAVVLAVCSAPGWLLGQDAPALALPKTTIPVQRAGTTSIEVDTARFMTPQTDFAIERGLAYLATRQDADGSFGPGSEFRRNVAVPALAGLAFLSAGDSPGRGKYGLQLERVVAYLLASQQQSGFLLRTDSPSHGPMYGHGFATLFLAEIYGMTPNDDVGGALKNAVSLIVNSQNPDGGWRYQPDGKDADISVTVCQIMALRAARNSGVGVPKATVDLCIEYVRKCQNTDGGFRYRLEPRPISIFPRSAAGLVALYSAGIYEGPEVERGMDYLLRYKPDGDLFRYESHYYYGHYYAAQAMWQAGGEYWTNWYPAIRDELLGLQRPDGSWPDSMICNEYATAMACIVLQMPNNFLPIFQR